MVAAPKTRGGKSRDFRASKTSIALHTPKNLGSIAGQEGVASEETRNADKT